MPKLLFMPIRTEAIMTTLISFFLQIVLTMLYAELPI